MMKTKSQLRADQIAKLQAEQEAYEKSVKDSVKTAAFARCAAVEEIYEMLGVKPEPMTTRDSKSGPVQVSSDKDETKRSVRLVEAVAQLIAARDDHAAAMMGQTLLTTLPGTAPVASGQTMGQRTIL